MLSSSESTTLCTYRGGVPIPKGRYQPVQSLTEGFLFVMPRVNGAAA